MSPDLARHGYTLVGSTWVRRVCSQAGQAGLRVELTLEESLLLKGLSYYRLRVVACEGDGWYSRAVLDRLYGTLEAALADPGPAALEAAVRLGATLGELGRGAW